MPRKTIAALTVACLAASIAPAMAGGLLGNVLSLDGDRDALVNVDLDGVVSETNIGGGDVSGNASGGIDATADIGDHGLLDVSIGGNGGVDADLDLDGSDDGLLGGLDLGGLDLGGGDGSVGGVDLGNVADLGDLTDGLDLGGLGLGGIDGDLLDGVDLAGLGLNLNGGLLAEGDGSLDL